MKAQYKGAIERYADLADPWQPGWLNSSPVEVAETPETPEIPAENEPGELEPAESDSLPQFSGIADLGSETFPQFPNEQESDNEFYWQQLSGRDYAYLTSPRATPAPCPWCRGRLHHSQHCDELRASWQPTMPFGKHRGKLISEVPLDYLDWLLANSETLDNELRDAIALRIKE